MNAHTRITQVCCPTCGGNIGEAPTLDRIRQYITQPSRLVIFDMLAKVPGKEVSRDQIYFRLYSHRRDGGPCVGETSVHVFLSMLRKQLEPYGWSVSSSRGGRGRISNYRLIPLEAGS